MECPNCGAELIYNDYYGIGNMAAQEKYGYGWEKLGDIYKCPNDECFETEEEATKYLKSCNQTLEERGVTDWTEVSCDSCTHNGFFYTDKQDNLHEGYPC